MLKTTSICLSGGPSLRLKMADRTRPIVRPGVSNGMVTKGYRKGVYEWVTTITSQQSKRSRLRPCRAGSVSYQP